MNDIAEQKTKLKDYLKELEARIKITEDQDASLRSEISALKNLIAVKQAESTINETPSNDKNDDDDDPGQWTLDDL